MYSLCIGHVVTPRVRACSTSSFGYKFANITEFSSNGIHDSSRDNKWGFSSKGVHDSSRDNKWDFSSNEVHDSSTDENQDLNFNTHSFTTHVCLSSKENDFGDNVHIIRHDHKEGIWDY